MIELRIAEEFKGPTLEELSPVLDDVADPVEARWCNTKFEITLVKQFKERHFCLVVLTLQELDQAANTLGKLFTPDVLILEKAKSVLTSRKTYNWRQFTEDITPGVAKGLLTKLCANAIRKGNKPELALVAIESILDSVSAVDADVLLRIRAMRGVR